MSSPSPTGNEWTTDLAGKLLRGPSQRRLDRRQLTVSQRVECIIFVIGNDQRVIGVVQDVPASGLFNDCSCKCRYLGIRPLQMEQHSGYLPC